MPVARPGVRPTVSEITEALLVFEEPILNSRFHQALAWHEDAKERAKLLRFPERVLEMTKAVRRGGFLWEHAPEPARSLSNEFVRSGERALLGAFLDNAENQIRTLAFIAAHAPTQASRTEFDRAIAIQRGMAETLRTVLSRRPGPASPRRRRELRSVREADRTASLRQQVEEAIRATRDAGKEPRELILSGNALRNLRDEGLFRGASQVLGVPVVVDLGWEASAFVLRTFESVRLEEVQGQARS